MGNPNLNGLSVHLVLTLEFDTNEEWYTEGIYEILVAFGIEALTKISSSRNSGGDDSRRSQTCSRLHEGMSKVSAANFSNKVKVYCPDIDAARDNLSILRDLRAYVETVNDSYIARLVMDSLVKIGDLILETEWRCRRVESSGEEGCFGSNPINSLTALRVLTNTTLSLVNRGMIRRSATDLHYNLWFDAPKFFFHYLKPLLRRFELTLGQIVDLLALQGGIISELTTPPKDKARAYVTSISCMASSELLRT
ncbi:uncharacterized protein BDR25DRAFT_358994 [Lindgomyces ingoldianus]|uniref:Uncharacterized protein n=1 Tax=Lindgomyces ingoldianus TaxID=673940 RepID=A0ACB6QIW5_9PLEO|nr:uncharacterized protein BDR25DRAFT_358994 [Lindgomyces ingoldianus]KAF2466933.1 hypothetical protein BDR25DRAFT_358994 [Lindgomyces ingoldianus]